MPKRDKNLILLREVFKFYKERTPEEDRVSYKEHKKILEVWGAEVNAMLLEGKDVNLFWGLSLLGVRKFEQFAYTDFQASKKAGKRVLKPNIHSDYYGAKVYWKRSKTTFNSRGYRFYPTRELQRAVHSVMRTIKGHTKFVMRANVYSKTAKNKYKRKVLKIN